MSIGTIDHIYWACVSVFRLLKPTESQQNEAVIAAISEILWNIGEKSKVLVALTGESNLIPHSHTYFQDSVTEKVWNLKKKKNSNALQYKPLKCSFDHVFSCFSSNSRSWKIWKSL